MELFDVSAVPSQVGAAEEMTRAAGYAQAASEGVGSKEKETKELLPGAAKRIDLDDERGADASARGDARTAAAAAANEETETKRTAKTAREIARQRKAKGVFQDAPNWPGIARFHEMVTFALD